MAPKIRNYGASWLSTTLNLSVTKGSCWYKASKYNMYLPVASLCLRSEEPSQKNVFSIPKSVWLTNVFTSVQNVLQTEGMPIKAKGQVKGFSYFYKFFKYKYFCKNSIL